MQKAIQQTNMAVKTEILEYISFLHLFLSLFLSYSLSPSMQDPEITPSYSSSSSNPHSEQVSSYQVAPSFL